MAEATIAWAEVILVVATTALLLVPLRWRRLSSVAPATSGTWNLPGFIVAIPFILMSGARVFSPAYAPDEVYFVNVAQQYMIHTGMSPLHLLAAPNLDGYGGVFWALVLLLLWIGSKFDPSLLDAGWFDTQYAHDQTGPGLFALIFIVRAVSLALLALWFWALVSASVRRSDFLRYLPALVVAMPLFWWSGKIASPELMAAALAGIAGIYLVKGRRRTAVVAGSLAFGLKVSAGPVLIFVAIYTMILEIRGHRPVGLKAKRISVLALCASVPWLLSNLFLVFRPDVFLANATRVTPSSGSWTLATLPMSIWQAWTDRALHWDYVTASGLGYWMGSIALFGAMLAFLVLERRWALAAGLLSTVLVTTVLLINASAQTYSWYYFPAILFGVSLLIYGRTAEGTDSGSDRQKRIANRVALVAMLALGAASVPAAVQERSQTLLQEADLSALPAQRSCIVDHIDGLREETVVDAGVIGSRSTPARIEALSHWEGEVALQRLTNGSMVYITGALSSERLLGVWLSKDLSVDLLGECGRFTIWHVEAP